MMLNIPPALRLTMIVGSLVFLLVICVLLRRKRLNVQYAIIWLAAAFGMVVFAGFPYLIAVLGNLVGIEMPANLVFVLLFAFVLLLLLSLSTIVTGFAERIRRLTQQQALLEKRVRELEAGQGTAPPAPQGRPPGAHSSPPPAGPGTL